MREIQEQDAIGAIGTGLLPVSQVSAAVSVSENVASQGELFALVDLSNFDILVLSPALEQICQSHLGQTPENMLEMSSASCRHSFCDTLQVLTNKTVQGHEEVKKETWLCFFLAMFLDSMFLIARHDCGPVFTAKQ